MDEKNTMNEAQTMPNEPLIKPVVQKQNPLLILLGVIIIVLLGSTGFLAYQNMQLQKQITGMKVAASPIPSATIDSTAGWRTFSDSNYNFTFKYPSNYGTTGGVSGPLTGSSNLVSSFSDSTTIREGTDAPFDGFNVYVVTDMKANSFEEYLSNELAQIKNNSYGNGANSTIEKINIPGINGSSISVSSIIKLYYLPSLDKKNIIVFSRIFVHQSFLPTFDQILSTFTFTDNTNNGDIFQIIKNLTKPMVWSMPQPDTAKNVSEQQLVGNTITSSIPEKAQDKLAPLLSTNSNLTTIYGFISLPNESAGGPMGNLEGYKKINGNTTQTILIRSDFSTNKYTVFVSN